MNTHASMTKKIPSTGIREDKAADLFRRNPSLGSPFKGFASFGKDGKPSVLLEVADTPETAARGLMGRKSLSEYCGMIFTGLNGGAFWMKGCLIPLDIVFVDSKGTVTKTYSMKADGGARRYGYDDEPVAMELSYGFCDRHGIVPGITCNWRTW